MPSATKRLAQKIHEWTHDATDPVDYAVIDSHIQYMESKRYEEYEPTRAPTPDFRTRLALSLECTHNAEAKKTLFRSVPHILFLGKNEFDGLYRHAMTEAVAFWLLELLDLPLNLTTAEQLEEASTATWYCPITDSMQVSAFYHVNNLSGKYRPTWQILKKFGDSRKIVDYMDAKGVERLVLLEDFVGSGSQMAPLVRFAAELPGERPVLLVPLVTCPDGATRGRELADNYANLSFAPVLELPGTAFLSATPQVGEPGLFKELRRLVREVSSLMEPGQERYYGPFGYRSTGGLVVMYTNCPDNSLPIIHRRSEHWDPMFPRSSRL